MNNGEEVKLEFYLEENEGNIALIDEMTGLYKIGAFFKASEALYQSNFDKKYAMIQLDIYRFKIINEICGFKVADELLVFIAGVIKKYTKIGGVVAHFRADVFVLCVPYVEQQELITIIKEISESISNYTLPCKILPTIGVSLIDNIHTESHAFFDRTSIALHTIKGNVFKNYAFYDASEKEKMLYETKIENEMGRALKNNEFKIYIQPKVDIFTGEIVGGEALVRWLHEKEGMISPQAFIPIFEKNGFIIKLDEYVWEQVFRLLHRWIGEGKKPLPISVNISRMNAYNNSFANRITKLAEHYNIDPRLVPLELTESAFLENTGDMFYIMKKLQTKGFIFSMDDYGSGYSSINMLRNIAVDEVKMDHAFLKEEMLSERTKIVLKYTLEMLKQLNTMVVAEGVETQEQVEFLKKNNCIHAQGYFFYKPMPIEEFEALIFG